MEDNRSESDLIKGLAGNDSEAINIIYRNEYRIIQSFIIKNNGSDDDARDIFQEAMTVLYEKACTEEFKLQCSIRTYLYAVSKNLWLKKLNDRSKNRIVDTEEFVDIIDANEDTEHFEKEETKFKVMNKALNNLGEPCKSIIEAFYIKQKKMNDIADEFGYTNADNAKTQKYKCLQRLKKIYFLIFDEL